jgi:asparagine synthase (glutamine-hydrolysing)
MPGIAGFVGPIPKEKALPHLEEMMRAMEYESFYSKGFYSNEALGVFVSWVLHPASFITNLPLKSRDGKRELFITGEVFDRGSLNSTSSDLAVLVNQESIDETAFSQLNGTFAGLLLDARTGIVELFNDRLGQERLYYAQPLDQDIFYFASEAKALLRVIPETRELDRKGVGQLLRYGCTFHERTLYRGISTLPPASVWNFSPRTAVPSKRKYFSPAQWEVDPAVDVQKSHAMIVDRLRRSVPRYLAGDSQVGLSLTGGWDTRMILAAHRPEPKTLPCYTFSGAEETVDVQKARQVAQLIRQDHHVLRLQADFFENFSKHAEKTIYVSDGYADICWSHEIYLNRLAKDIAPVRLTGNFGSEVLRGVTTFREIPLHEDWFKGELSQELHESSGEWDEATIETHPARFAAFKEIPWKLATVTRLANSQVRFRSPFLDLEILRLACCSPVGVSGPSLPPASVMNLQPSLVRIPTDRGESSNNGGLGEFLRRVWYKGSFKLDYWACEGAPGFMGLLFDRSNGYRFLPKRHRYLNYRSWLRGPLREYASDLLNNRNAFVAGLLGPRTASRLLHDHISGRRNVLPDISALMTLELIEKCLLRASRTSNLQAPRICSL